MAITIFRAELSRANSLIVRRDYLFCIETLACTQDTSSEEAIGIGRRSRLVLDGAAGPVSRANVGLAYLPSRPAALHCHSLFGFYLLHSKAAS